MPEKTLIDRYKDDLIEYLDNSICDLELIPKARLSELDRTRLLSRLDVFESVRANAESKYRKIIDG